MKYDLIIIGAGPSGVSSAIYAKSRGMHVLLLEKNKVGGIIAGVSSVTHYASVDAEESGISFARKMEDQLCRAGIDVIYEEVIEVHLQDVVKQVTTNVATYEADCVIIAAGSTPRKLETKGLYAFTGKAVALNPYKDAHLCKGKDVYVIGGADGAVKEALYLAGFAKRVYIVCIERELACIQEFKDRIEKCDNIFIKPHVSLIEVTGGEYIHSLVFEDVHSNVRSEEHSDAAIVFVYAGLIANTQLFSEVHQEQGYIVVNEKQQTSVAGVYAVGDLCKKQVRQVATAVSDGAVASIHAYLNKK